MNVDLIKSELQFKALRSSGSGGQHVNKVATKIELQFDLEASNGLEEDEKEKLKETLANKLTKDGRLILQCSVTRSQHRNKEIAIERFFQIIEEGLQENEERKTTKVPKAVKKKRLENKRKQARKKANRKPPEID